MARTDRTIKEKTAFLAALRDGYSVTAAAAAAGVGRRTVYDWRDKSPDFANDWEDAWESGGDWVEDKLRERMEKGDTTAIIVGLKMRRRFIDRQEHTGEGGGEVKIRVIYGDGN